MWFTMSSDREMDVSEGTRLMGNIQADEQNSSRPMSTFRVGSPHNTYCVCMNKLLNIEIRVHMEELVYIVK